VGAPEPRAPDAGPPAGERCAHDRALRGAGDGAGALREAVRYAVEAPGKRLRPSLVIAAYRAIRPAPPGDALYGLASAVELIHTYSLVHDDLPCMDDDALRRGRPTLHVAFSPGHAVLAGAALIPFAFARLDRCASALGCGRELRTRLAAELAAAAGAGGMVGGQWLDLDAEARGDAVPQGALERIHRLKTGALLTASLRLGGLAADASPPALAALTRFGGELGLAFQIVDDLLDVTGTDAQLGKTAGKDTAAGKATYPARFGVEGARRIAAERIDGAIRSLDGAVLDIRELTSLAAFVLERVR
jgi:farnesyl diphosphate synthase